MVNVSEDRINTLKDVLLNNGMFSSTYFGASQTVRNRNSVTLKIQITMEDAECPTNLGMGS